MYQKKPSLSEIFVPIYRGLEQFEHKYITQYIKDFLSSSFSPEELDETFDEPFHSYFRTSPTQDNLPQDSIISEIVVLTPTGSYYDITQRIDRIDITTLKISHITGVQLISKVQPSDMSAYRTELNIVSGGTRVLAYSAEGNRNLVKSLYLFGIKVTRAYNNFQVLPE